MFRESRSYTQNPLYAEYHGLYDAMYITIRGGGGGEDSSDELAD